jgi:prepilin-type N-terminal cleavage/methylation domain-containing protein
VNDPKQQLEHGFTLIEIIITFVVGSILAAMAMPYFLSGAMSSHTPIERLQVSSSLNQAMETILADYNINYSSPTKNTLDAFAAKVKAFSTKYYSDSSLKKVEAETTTVGSLETALLVTVTSSNGEKIYHVFTIQSK